MQFDQELQLAKLIRRYKRFLADIELPDGSVTTIHCPNTGSMKNCQPPAARVWFTDSGNAKRKYPCTWQLVETQGPHLVGINTGLANKLAIEAITSNWVGELQGYDELKTEVSYGSQNSRIDILLENSPAKNSPASKCYVEVKNVSLGLGSGLGVFPDAVTLRGQKHLQELIEMRNQGHRAVLLFCVQHSGIDTVAPADDIDPDYGRLLREASACGVEILAYGAEFDLKRSSIELRHRLQVRL